MRMNITRYELQNTDFSGVRADFYENKKDAGERLNRYQIIDHRGNPLWIPRITLAARQLGRDSQNRAGQILIERSHDRIRRAGTPNHHRRRPQLPRHGLQFIA